MIGKNDPERQKAVTKTLKDANVKFVQLHFLDIDGKIKSVGKSIARLENMIENGESFDGSSISGYGRTSESDQVLLPDLSTLAILPWRTEDSLVARFICDIYNPDGSRYEGDPRFILQKALEKARKEGLTYYAAPELEFFLLKSNEQDTPTMTDLRGYFDLDFNDVDQRIRREIALYAEQFPNIKVETVHHEVARSQHEIDFIYGEAHHMADATWTMKLCCKMVAAKYGYIATFMPKPWQGHNGSGMHVHQSLWKAGKNLFWDDADPNKISETMRNFIAGQLHYAKEITAVLNSWPNSYKRLVPGYECPTYIAWGFKNRSMLHRIPWYTKASGARVEIRSPDPACNPYLGLAALLTAGLEGIKKKMQPPAPIELNIFQLSKEEMDKLGVDTLPESLGQALHYYRHSELMQEVMGPTAYKSFLDSKTNENQAYNTQVSDWELKRYSQQL